jgi:hypothetical protein
MILEFLPDAAADLFEAADYYESKQEGLGRRFRNEVLEVCGLIVQHPLLWRERVGGYRRVNCPVFPSGLARRRRAKPEGKKEAVWGGVLPRAAASAALPWANIRPPRWGSGKANQRAALDVAGALCFYFNAHWRRASEPERLTGVQGVALLYTGHPAGVFGRHAQACRSPTSQMR